MHSQWVALVLLVFLTPLFLLTGPQTAPKRLRVAMSLNVQGTYLHAGPAEPRPDHGIAHMHRLLTVLKHEILEAIPPFVFFLIAFHLLALTRLLMEAEYGIEARSIMNLTIAALVVAKVILLADLLPFVNRFPDKPLAWNIAWKTLIYMLAACVVAYLERLWEFHGNYGSIAAANSHMVEEVVWPHFWAVQLWMSVLMLQFCTLREFARFFGGRRLRALFFGPLSEVEGLAGKV